MFLPTLPAKTFLLVLLVCLNTACPSSKPSQEEVESQKQGQQNLPGEGGGITDQDKAAAAKLEQERVAKELAYKAAQEQGQQQDVPLSDEGNQSDSWSETGGGAGGNQPLLSDGEEEDKEKDQRKQKSGQQNPPGGGGAVTEEQKAEKELAAQELANKEEDGLGGVLCQLNEDKKVLQCLIVDSSIAFNSVPDENQLDRMKKENEAAIKIQVEEVVAEEKKNNDVEPKTDPSEIPESESMHFNDVSTLNEAAPGTQSEPIKKGKKGRRKKEKKANKLESDEF